MRVTIIEDSYILNFSREKSIFDPWEIITGRVPLGFRMPRDFSRPAVWIQETGSKLLFFKTADAMNPLTTYDLPSPKVKNKLFYHEEFKKLQSMAYKDDTIMEMSNCLQLLFSDILTLWKIVLIH